MKNTGNKVTLSSLKVKDFEVPFKKADKEKNKKLWLSKIKLKYELFKTSYSFQKVQEFKEKLENSKEERQRYTSKELNDMKKTYQKNLEDWTKIVHLANTIQKNDPHFNYNFDPIYVK